MNKKLILASSSPRRHSILKKFGIKFKVIPANIDEDKIDKTNPIKYVETVARMKAEKVANETQRQNAIVIAADTVVLIGNDLVGKLYTKDEMRNVLKKLSGQPHKILTGVAVIDTENGKILQDYDESEVRFRNLSKETINHYVNSMSWQDKAGGYNIEEVEEEFVEEIKGDYYNILGLPVKKLNGLLSKIGLSLETFIEKR